MDLQAPGNRSGYRNSLLHRELTLAIKQQIITALTEDLQDPLYLAEISEWDQLSVDLLFSAGKIADIS
jgi:hypothetical protein